MEDLVNTKAGRSFKQGMVLVISKLLREIYEKAWLDNGEIKNF